MFTIIGADQKQYGPVTTEEVRQWIRDGRADGRTLARSDEAGGDWKPLASFPEFAAFTASSGIPPRLPGAPVSYAPAATPRITETQLLAGEPDFSVGECLGHAWELWLNNFVPLTGACALVWLLELVPIFGALLSGVLYGGLYFVYLKRIRGQAASMGEALSGFSNAFLQLFLAGFISGLLSSLAFLLCGVGWIYFKIAWLFCLALVIDQRHEFWTAMELSRKVVGRVWLKVFGLAVIAFAPAILIKGYTSVKSEAMMFDAMQAMMAHGQLDFAKLMTAAMEIAHSMTALNMLSLVVMLVNLPFGVGALMYAYETLFRPRPTPGP